ncbi:MAG: hypothetical protein DBY37_01610 [Desulfovibrionaceae bacterium]|nr:MAG: hypothetical protein DBY37_01610 [Desulfovibrionaceae bacterium]
MSVERIAFENICGPERFAPENICGPAPVFRPAGFTPPPELYASNELRLLRHRGFSLAPLD